jgi:integrative and conjugative element protein (TIGR02256 family)
MCSRSEKLIHSDIDLVMKIPGTHNHGLIVVEPNALNTMRSLRQIRSKAHEAGGVMIGERRGNSFIVKEVTTPSSEDTSSRFKFVRNYHHHQSSVIKANMNSGGTSNYLGEWHTHPEDQPYPSAIDFKNWKKSLHKRPPCLVVVVGRKGDWWAIHEHGRFYHLVSISGGK